MFLRVTVIFVWLPWFFFDFYGIEIQRQSSTPSNNYMVGLIMVAIGIPIGLVISASIYRKMKNINQDIINQINELKGGDDDK